VEDLKRLNKTDGSGCILAHCMGLGKTLSVISFISTLMFNQEETGIRTCLVVTPLNTVLNWQAEFQKWLGEDSMDVYEMSSIKNNWGRMETLEAWHETGGILIIGYELYRILTQHQRVKNKKQKLAFTRTLADPGQSYKFLIAVVLYLVVYRAGYCCL
jgi:transcriptional regulator ATRX